MNTVWAQRREENCSLYNEFCGSCSTPFIEPETRKFSRQLSAYLLPLRRSAGQACPAYFFTVSGDDGQKFHSNPNARTRLSADSNVPWKYCGLGHMTVDTCGKRYLPTLLA